jgi:predicted ATPase
MITTLRLTNFRGFKSLDLAGLRPVNLVVGRNNAGKTSLLEAIVLIADPQKIGQLQDSFRSPGAAGQRDSVRWLMRDGSDVVTSQIEAEEEGQAHRLLLSTRAQGTVTQNGFQIFANFERFVAAIPGGQKALKFRVISVKPQSPDEIVKLFGLAVSRKGGEELMDKLFHDMDNRIRKVRANPGDDGIQVRFDIDLSEMVPLSQMGQGANRLISIFSQLIVQDTDICVIDEIENGIHHSMLEQVWAGIAVAAKNLRIQVFATTHSYECIEAADSAFAMQKSYDFSIIQLFRSTDGVQGRVLDRKHIEAALSGKIDLR